jgi:hypothetical protein
MNLSLESGRAGKENLYDRFDWSKITLKELAGFVSEELRKRGIDTVLVGGACVTIYSENRYLSEVERWSLHEKQPEKFRIFLERLEKIKHSR